MTVELKAHDPEWKVAFATEAELLRHAFGAPLIAVHHIGSTAIPGIMAKPIIDILCVVDSLSSVDAANSRMIANGYVPKGENGIVGRRYFQKFDGDGVRSHHIHVFQTGSPHIERHLAFRDYLIAHPDKAQAYSAWKTELLQSGIVTREAYQNGKSCVVELLQSEALCWYHDNRDPQAHADG